VSDEDCSRDADITPMERFTAILQLTHSSPVQNGPFLEQIEINYRKSPSLDGLFFALGILKS